MKQTLVIGFGHECDACGIDLTMLHGAECMPSGFLNGKNIDKLAYERYMDAFVGGVTLEGRCIGWFGR